MQVSNRGLTVIKEFEGWRPRAYLCPAGKWTIGYGHTADAGPPPVKAGDVIASVARNTTTVVGGASGGAVPLLAAELATDRPLVVVCADGEAAKRFGVISRGIIAPMALPRRRASRSASTPYLLRQSSARSRRRWFSRRATNSISGVMMPLRA